MMDNHGSFSKSLRADTFFYFVGEVKVGKQGNISGNHLYYPCRVKFEKEFNTGENISEKLLILDPFLLHVFKLTGL